MAALNRRQILNIFLIYLKNRRKKVSLMNKAIAILLHFEEKRNLIVRQCLLHIEAILLLVQEHEEINRRERRKARSCRRSLHNTGWWDLVRDTYSPERFYETLRMSRATFNHILVRIHDKLLKKTVTEEPIPPDFRLAITIYKLARGDYIYTIGEMCGLAKSTVCVIVIETCSAIINTLWDDTVKKYFPTSRDDFKESMAKFGEEWQFPYAFAAVDGSHLPIKCPKGGAQAMKQYFNFKGFYSIVLMALVDAEYRFIWASVGAPGNTHDSTLMQSTELWDRTVAENVIPNIAQQIENVDIPPLILGDGAFPLRTWIMKPHGDAVLPEDKRYFNYRHSRARLVIEGAFGRLKSRFRVLFRKCESNKETVKLYGLASVVLHDLCIELGDLVPRKFDLTLDYAANKRLSPEEVKDMFLHSETRNKRILRLTKNLLPLQTEMLLSKPYGKKTKILNNVICNFYIFSVFFSV